MIRQLRELSRSEPSCLKYETLDNDAELDTTGFLFLEPGNDLFSSTFESQVLLFIICASWSVLVVSQIKKKSKIKILKGEWTEMVRGSTRRLLSVFR